ncbi:MAG: hypothetical protein ACYS26_19405 [Planctomycetota bacterium]
MILLSFLAAAAAPALPAGPGDFAGAAPAPFVVPAGTTQIYDTDVQGTLYASDVILESGSTLEVRGSQPLLIIAERRISLDGWIVANGQPGTSVIPPSLGIVGVIDPWPGAPAVAGGGAGGTSSQTLQASTPKGGDAPGIGGGRGGASGYAPSNGAFLQLGGSGGGGRFAADDPVPSAGFQALPGGPGTPNAISAITGLNPPEGGAAGSPVFVDGDPNNDFFGYGLDEQTGAPILGELAAPRGGFGGGAGGDAIQSGGFPQLPWNVDLEWQGGPGGGGGGLVALFARQVIVGPGGRIEVNGGFGGRGGYAPPSLLSLGGCGGGGSGGMILMQAGSIDLTEAPFNCFRALGGAGAFYDLSDLSGGPIGGNGSAGLIQLHVASTEDIRLPQGQLLASYSSPDSKQLLPFPLN